MRSSAVELSGGCQTFDTTQTVLRRLSAMTDTSEKLNGFSGPETYVPERTREGEPEPEGLRAALDCVSTYNLSIRTCKKKATRTYIY